MLHRHKPWWLTHALQMPWDLFGGMWGKQCSNPPFPCVAGEGPSSRHIGHHHPLVDPERQIGSVPEDQWWIAAAEQPDTSFVSLLWNKLIPREDRAGLPTTLTRMVRSYHLRR